VGFVIIADAKLLLGNRKGSVWQQCGSANTSDSNNNAEAIQIDLITPMINNPDGSHISQNV